MNSLSPIPVVRFFGMRMRTAILCCVLAAAVAAVVWLWLPFSWNPVQPDEAICVATARRQDGATLYRLRPSGGSAESDTTLLAAEGLRPSLRLERGELVAAAPVWSWSSANWCQVEGLSTGTRDTRAALCAASVRKSVWRG